MSGDATQTLPRRADAPSFDEYMLRDAADGTANPGGPASIEIEAGDVEFWGVERKTLLGERARLWLRQILVATAMVSALFVMVQLVSGTESENDGSTVAAEVPPSLLAESETQDMRSSSNEPNTGALALAQSRSPLLGLGEVGTDRSGESQDSTEVTSIEAQESRTAVAPTTVAPTTTAAPTTAAPTTVAPTTAAPTTAAPTTVASTTAAAEATESGTEESVAAASEPANVEGGATGPGDPEPNLDEAAETQSEAVVEPAEEPAQPSHPEGWVDAGHGVYLPAIFIEIRRCESGHNYAAANPRSSARGAYQFLRGSWADYGHRDRYGVAEAHLATPAQQDEAALITWQRSGTRPWNASKHCWG